MASDQRVLDAILRFGLDKQAAGETRAGLDSVKRGLSEVEKQALQTRQQLMSLRQVGVEIGLVGVAIGGPLLLAAKSFVAANKDSSLVARQWLADTDRITAS